VDGMTTGVLPKRRPGRPYVADPAVPIPVRLRLSAVEGLRVAAERHEQTMAGIIRLAIRQYLAEQGIAA
jgi:hypothetical protein